MMRKLRASLGRFAGCQRGLSAIEFALVAPIMITTYFGAFEMCDILVANRKVTNVAAATTDLVAQATQIADADMTNIFNAATAIMTPYDAGVLQITVSSVNTDAGGQTKIAWSDALHTTARAVGSSYTLPTGLATPGGSIIMTEVSFTYSTPIGTFVTNGITFSDKFYQRPRRVTVIPRV
ncbi:MAG: TadE/TadG family type IV pilus assembly protein [Alphaproteobacteria bacterium]